MREIIFDTETTGLDPLGGDRIIEIGAIEMFNHVPTGRTYHQYLNPGDRQVHPDAEAVHGISNDDLKDKPAFADVMDDFLAFFQDGRLIAHNASFDIGFFDAEMRRVGLKPFARSRVLDTLAVARLKYPGARNSLDALCQRYGIDNSHREKHGALLDSELLAEVYIELIGGKQASLTLGASQAVDQFTGGDGFGGTGGRPKRPPAKQRPTPLAPRLTPEDEARHAEFVQSFKTPALWLEPLGIKKTDA
ncbi:MAG: DNA polymerase III subunit epsilon [Pseudomonadota bacterium]